MNDMSARVRVVQVCLWLIAGIAVAGGTLQLVLGQPETTPRLDNVHRFMAGIYLSTGIIAAWCAWTIRRQTVLPYLLALGVAMGGMGRLISMATVGVPEPAALWLGYLVPELVLPVVIAVCWWGVRGASGSPPS